MTTTCLLYRVPFCQEAHEWWKLRGCLKFPSHLGNGHGSAGLLLGDSVALAADAAAVVALVVCFLLTLSEHDRLSAGARPRTIPVELLQHGQRKTPKQVPGRLENKIYVAQSGPEIRPLKKSVPLKNNWREKKSSWPVRILRCMCRSAACVGVENCRSHQDPSSRSVHRPMLCFRHACKQWK